MKEELCASGMNMNYSQEPLWELDYAHIQKTVCFGNTYMKNKVMDCLKKLPCECADILLWADSWSNIQNS